MYGWIEGQLGEKVLNIIPTESGSGATSFVQTQTGCYIAKAGERQDFLDLYEKVLPLLESAGLKQSHIVARSERIVLYEWIAGDTCKVFSEVQTIQAIKYIKKYFEALRSFPINDIKLKRQNAWDDAQSLEFLLDKLPDTGIFSVSPSIAEATARLSKIRDLITKLPKQLIHGDLGADNFLMRGNMVTSIIDFTPQIAPEMYGLCQFLYWNVLWHEESAASLHTWAKVYSEEVDKVTFDCCMLQAALFRVVGPLLNGITTVNKRVQLLEVLLESSR